MSARADDGRDPPAVRVLARLLARGEAARLRADPDPASLSMTGRRDAAEYLALRRLEEVETFHARIRLAERAGAIQVARDAHRGDGERLLRLTVLDLEALAGDLGATPLAARVDAASALLRDWLPRFPVLGEAVAHWRQGGKVRRRGPEAAAALADAARVVAARRADAGQERILRRESVRLFGSGRSKHLETLTGWLDLLATGELAASGLEQEQVWSLLGLRRAPQPMLVAGQGRVAMADGAVLPLVRPWLGLPLEAVRALFTDARCVLTVENLASFHEAADIAAGEPVLLLYTGGMPSPAWRAAYARLLDGLAPDAALYHWGDIDRGGFRIAAKLADTAAAAGYRLRPWRMSPDDLPAAALAELEAPEGAVLSTMRHWAERAGWHDVSQALQRHPVLVEQELLDPLLPPAAGAPDRPG